MEQEIKFPKRKPTRAKNFDYNSSGAYFITICTKDRRPILSNIVGTGVLDCPKIELTEYGEIVEKYIKKMTLFYDNISIEKYVIMPNHVHILLLLRNHERGNLCNGQSGTPVPTNIARANSVFSRFVSTLKRFCNKECGTNIWQARSNDHIIRNQEDYARHLRYICENPSCWYYDELCIEEEKASFLLQT